MEFKTSEYTVEAVIRNKVFNCSNNNCNAENNKIYKRQRTCPPIIQIPSPPTTRTCSAILVPYLRGDIDKIEKTEKPSLTISPWVAAKARWLTRMLRLHVRFRWGALIARGAQGVLPMRVGGATSQLDLPSLTPLSVAGCGWLQPGVPQWAASVHYCK